MKRTTVPKTEAVVLQTMLSRAYAHSRFEMARSLFTATIFGRPDNWSLSQLSNPETKAEFGNRLGMVLQSLRVGKALAPSPVNFTDRIIDSTLLTTKVSVGGFTLWRNPDMPADGVPILPGEAYVISPSSCPVTLMARQGVDAFGLHTGRDCLIDRNELKYCMPGRAHGSICSSALERLGAPEEVYVKVFWSIPGVLFPHDVEHPDYGPMNRAMHAMIWQRWGAECAPRRGGIFYPDLPKIIRAQCVKAGVPEENIDLSHAYQQPSGTWLEGKPGTPRNLVVITRLS